MHVPEDYKLIAQYLDTLSEVQEDRLLTGKLIPGQISTPDGRGCLLGTAIGAPQIRKQYTNIHDWLPREALLFNEEHKRAFGGSSASSAGRCLIRTSLCHKTIQQYDKLCTEDPCAVNIFVREYILERRVNRMLACSALPKPQEMAAV